MKVAPVLIAVAPQLATTSAKVEEPYVPGSRDPRRFRFGPLIRRIESGAEDADMVENKMGLWAKRD
jgi:hypothetical protein